MTEKLGHREDSPEQEPQPFTETPEASAEHEKIVEAIRAAREEFSRECPEEYYDAGGNETVQGLGTYFTEHLPSPEIFKETDFDQKYIKGRDVIDLGCGGQENVQKLAVACGAKRYIGIDRAHLPGLDNKTEEVLEEEAGRARDNTGGEKWDKAVAAGFLHPSAVGVEGFPAVSVCSDMLKALGKFKTEGNKFFMMAGIDGVPQKYAEYLSKEIDRLASDGDALMEIGNGKRAEIGLALEERGFTREVAPWLDVQGAYVWVKGKEARKKIKEETVAVMEKEDSEIKSAITDGRYIYWGNIIDLVDRLEATPELMRENKRVIDIVDFLIKKMPDEEKSGEIIQKYLRAYKNLKEEQNIKEKEEKSN